MASTLSVGDYTLDLVRGELTGPVGTLPLSELEVSFVAYLARRADTVVPKKELLREVWGYAESARSRAVDATLNRVRSKLEGTGITIESLWGRGLQLTAVATAPRARAESQLVGRDEERAALEALLEEPGLVCLWGPPGIGKTALAQDLAVGHELQGHGEMSLERELCGRLASDPQGLTAALERERPVLVLDEAESRTAGELELVRAWARSTPVLVISTVKLEARAEWRLAPLDEDSAQLLLQREVQVGDTWARRLVACTDRLPRQITLLAEAVRFVGPEAVLEMGAGAFPAMEEAVGALWSGLDEQERQLLSTVSVFHGRFDVMAVAHVLDRSPFQVLPVLERLWARSLVQGEHGVFHLLAPVRAVAARNQPADVEQRLVRWCRWLLDENARGGVRWYRHQQDIEAMLLVCDDSVAPELGVLVAEWLVHDPDMAGLRAALVRDGVQRPVILALLVIGYGVNANQEDARRLAVMLDTPLPTPEAELTRQAALAVVGGPVPELVPGAPIPLPLYVALLTLVGGSGQPVPIDLCERYALLCEEAGYGDGMRALYAYASRSAAQLGDPRWVELGRKGGVEGRVMVELRCGDPDRALAVCLAQLELETNHLYRLVLAGLAATLYALTDRTEQADALIERFPATDLAFYLQLALLVRGREACFPDPIAANWVEQWRRGTPPGVSARVSDRQFFFGWALRRVAPD